MKIYIERTYRKHPYSGKYKYENTTYSAYIGNDLILKKTSTWFNNRDVKPSIKEFKKLLSDFNDAEVVKMKNTYLNY